MADDGPCLLPLPQSVMQSSPMPPADLAWSLQRRVLPQHTDHAGVMWHGAYLAWLEEARVEALATVGLAYSVLSARGLELLVVHLAITYQAPLLHGEWVEVRSLVLPRRGLRLPWRSWFVGPGNTVAAQALVELVLVDFSAGADRRRPLRHPPADLAVALNALVAGPIP
jgi:acyl-CoA thioester hydrolase